MMNKVDTSGTRPPRDFAYLSIYLNDARSIHLDFIRQINSVESLYHYTNLEGLKGIASDHDLWLTNALYSNDEAETKLGLEVAREQIAAMLDAPTEIVPPDYLRELDKLLAQPREGVYICCFCEQGDRLSQW